MKTQRFELKEEHLKLLQRFAVGWQDCEFGAPEIDPKRPYGNSDVYQDIVEILGLKKMKEGIYKFVLFGEECLLTGEDEYNIDFGDEDELCKMLSKLHKETEIALQICLVTLSFKPGIYECEEYGNDWKFVK